MDLVLLNTVFTPFIQLFSHDSVTLRLCDQVKYLSDQPKALQ